MNYSNQLLNETRDHSMTSNQEELRRLYSENKLLNERISQLQYENVQLKLMFNAQQQKNEAEKSLLYANLRALRVDLRAEKQKHEEEKNVYQVYLRHEKNKSKARKQRIQKLQHQIQSMNFQQDAGNKLKVQEKEQDQNANLPSKSNLGSEIQVRQQQEIHQQTLIEELLRLGDEKPVKKVQFQKIPSPKKTK